MNKLILLFLTFFITLPLLHLQAQTGLQITSTCENDSLCLPANECVATNQTFSISATTDCSTNNVVEYNFSIDWDDDGVVDSLGSTSNFTADFPIGIHRVTFTVFDFCGGEESCEFVFEVMDCVAPVIECPSEIDTFYLISSSGEIEIPISEFISSNNYDNCTAVENLAYSYSPNSIDTLIDFWCGDIAVNGIIPFPIWVTDESGNQDSCIVEILLIDVVMANCDPATIIYLLNTSFWQGGGMTPNYTLNGFPTPPYFLTFSPISSGSILNVEYDGNSLNGVSTFDLVLISKHILGTETFTSPYQNIAADVNFSGTITALDLALIRSLILHISDEFPSGQSWVFDPPTQVIQQGLFNYNFTGIKLGDVNGTANPNDFQSNQIESRTFDSALNIFAKNQTFKAGETITLTTFSNNFKNIMGGQFTIDFDPTALDFQKIEGNNSLELGEQNFGKSNVDDGFILCSWNTSASQNLKQKEDFFEITFTAKKDGKLSDFLTINSKKLAAEIYVENGDDFVFWNAELNFENEKLENAFSISPNPFSEKTTFSFSLEKEGKVELEIFDTNGRLVFSQQKNMLAGENQIQIQKTNLPGNGIYFYKIKTGNQLNSGKLILF